MARAPSGFAQDRAAFAQQRFARGSTLFDAHRYEPALTEFRASYDLYASPNSLLYAARCLRELGRLDEALLVFERAEHEAGDRAQSDPRFSETARVAHAGASALRARMGGLLISIAGPPDASPVTVTVNGREVPREALAVAVATQPGRAHIEARADGYLAASSDVDVTVGHDVPVSLTLAPRPPAPAPRVISVAPVRILVPAPVIVHASPAVPRALGITALSLGAIGFAGYGLSWWMANQQFDAARVGCDPDFACDTVHTDRIDAGRTWQTLTNVSLGLGIGGAAVGTALLIWSAIPGRERTLPTVTASREGVFVVGVF